MKDKEWERMAREEGVMDMIRSEVAMTAMDMWEEQGDPTQPFGFPYRLDIGVWSIEVHCEDNRLACYKVTHTGQLMELIKVRL